MTRELEYLREALEEAETAARWYAARSLTFCFCIALQGVFPPRG